MYVETSLVILSAFSFLNTLQLLLLSVVFYINAMLTCFSLNYMCVYICIYMYIYIYICIYIYIDITMLRYFINDLHICNYLYYLNKCQ